MTVTMDASEDRDAQGKRTAIEAFAKFDEERDEKVALHARPDNDAAMVAGEVASEGSPSRDVDQGMQMCSSTLHSITAIIGASLDSTGLQSLAEQVDTDIRQLLGEGQNLAQAARTELSKCEEQFEHIALMTNNMSQV
jgi:hypothetical protein